MPPIVPKIEARHDPAIWDVSGRVLSFYFCGVSWRPQITRLKLSDLVHSKNELHQLI
jgi:hypothetical protein